MIKKLILPNGQTRYLFFSGKGGVGKTSLSCATAVWLAKNGYKTLVVSTDLAPDKLTYVFEQKIGPKVTKVNGTENLYAIEIDPEMAAEEYRNRILDPMRKFLPQDALKVMEEQLRSPCSTEMATFDKFIEFTENSQFDVIIFDTAPTGHTLRLLELPSEWSKFIEMSSRGAGQTCIGPVQSLQTTKEKYDRAVKMMKDKNKTTFVFIVQPEATPIYETNRAIEELKTVGIDVGMLIVNAILPKEQCTDEFFRKRREMQEKYLKEIDNKFQLPSLRMNLLETDIKGVNTLSKVGEMLLGGTQ